ncbi:MAG: MTH938/NDUFAF3 family protein [Thermodesulfobacteriota bacterium]|nr:MTH938/NDUFAF3 family protein [Thermodesulfobacteriota bacterium]
MKIDAFSFGSLVIEGKRYTSDLVIYTDRRIVDSWYRKSGHILLKEDIDQLIASDPEVIIAGTGIDGRMIPERKLEESLVKSGIGFYFAPNKKAVDLFNELSLKKRTGACFHLTC